MSLRFNASNHRYTLDGKSVRGVTGLISGGTPKDALIWWSATKAGEWAAENKAALPTMADESIIREAKMAHKQARDSAARARRRQGVRVHE